MDIASKLNELLDSIDKDDPTISVHTFGNVTTISYEEYPHPPIKRHEVTSAGIETELRNIRANIDRELSGKKPYKVERKKRKPLTPEQIEHIRIGRLAGTEKRRLALEKAKAERQEAKRLKREAKELAKLEKKRKPRRTMTEEEKEARRARIKTGDERKKRAPLTEEQKMNIAKGVKDRFDVFGKTKKNK